MPFFFRLQPAWLRRMAALLLVPIILTFLVFLRIAKGIMNGFSEFAEVFGAIWRGKEKEDAMLPCPFCGGKGLPDGWQTQGGATGPACDECGATAWSVDIWNTRTPVDEELLKKFEEKADQDEGRTIIK